jgi:hypothetical protein
MKNSTLNAFLALVLTQAAHSTEEFFFALYDEFAPARFISGLLNDDLAAGFVMANTGFFLFGLWCYFARVRPGHPNAAAWMWPWIFVSLSNGIIHTAMAIQRGGYFPGVVTAPLLFILAAVLAVRLLRGRGHAT